MGIPAYFSSIIRSHAKIFKPISSFQMPIHHLYMDCNSIIYDVIHKIDFNVVHKNDYVHISNSVCDEIKKIILTIKPTNNVFIAFDGVCPLAKLHQQRNRRYKSLYQNHFEKTVLKSEEKFNTTCITPGSQFMQCLNDIVKQTFTDSHYCQRMIISCGEEPQEGEHKLYKYMRDHPSQHSHKTTVIYGLDSDLIMLSINHLPIAPNIYLYRETPYYIQNLNSDLHPDISYLIDIGQLSQTISVQMSPDNVTKNCIHDYIFLCFFLGNDFLPHFPSCNIRTGGIEKLMKAYTETIGSTNDVLTDGHTIYWNNVRKIVEYMAIKEEKNFHIEHMKRDRRQKQFTQQYDSPTLTNEEKLEQLNISPQINRQIEKKINPFRMQWQKRYYQHLFPKQYSIPSICENYLQGLEWTMKYYTIGCPDFRWTYHYNYPPLFSDLLRYIPTENKEMILPNDNQPVSELVQLAYVLPKQSLHLLPSHLHQKLLHKKSHWYDDQCTFSTAYCTYFWESHVNLPVINVDELIDFVHSDTP